jgi:hypothetical protein
VISRRGRRAAKDVGARDVGFGLVVIVTVRDIALAGLAKCGFESASDTHMVGAVEARNAAVRRGKRT